MTIETALSEIMIDTVTVAPVATKDTYGKRAWGTPSTLTKCRVQTGNYKFTDSSGQEKTAVGKVYVPGSPSLTLNDKLTLPDSSVPVILGIDRFNDELGSNHTVIHYGAG